MELLIPTKKYRTSRKRCLKIGVDNRNRNWWKFSCDIIMRRACPRESVDYLSGEVSTSLLLFISSVCFDLEHRSIKSVLHLQVIIEK